MEAAKAQNWAVEPQEKNNKFNRIMNYVSKQAGIAQSV
jgi:hypothetical protein